MHQYALEDFFRSLDLTIRREMRSGQLAAYPSFQRITNRRGRFSFAVEYWDTSRLFAISQVHFLPGDRPVVFGYVYQYQRGDRTIFRYDDAPHFPHHKPIGSEEIAYPCYQPTLADILREVEDILAGGEPTVPATF